MVAASGARWRDRSKDHGENNQTRQGCRQTRALAEGRLQGEAGRQAEISQTGCEEAEVRLREGETLSRQDGDENRKPGDGHIECREAARTCQGEEAKIVQAHSSIEAEGCLEGSCPEKG